MEYLGYFFSILIGIILGLIGAGGSILIIPVLVYLFRFDTEKATSYSLFIIGFASLIGSISQYKLGNLKLKTAIIFASPSILSVLLVRNFLLPIIPNSIFWINNFEISKNKFLMLFFALLMLVASIFMIKKNKTTVHVVYPCKIINLLVLGFLVGIITGLLGAGGGFIIIPALLFFGNLTMKQAVGTSLFIIFVNSSAGFMGDLVKGVHLNYSFLLLISIFAMVGMGIGTQLSKKIDSLKLKSAFGWIVLIIGIFIISKELFI